MWLLFMISLSGMIPATQGDYNFATKAECDQARVEWQAKADAEAPKEMMIKFVCAEVH